jgi:hypothetical protein
MLAVTDKYLFEAICMNIAILEQSVGARSFLAAALATRKIKVDAAKIVFTDITHYINRFVGLSPRLYLNMFVADLPGRCG